MDFTGIFLIAWFYLYAGLSFGLLSNAMSLFKTKIWGQVILWPVFAFKYMIIYFKK